LTTYFVIFGGRVYHYFLFIHVEYTQIVSLYMHVHAE